MAEYRVINPTIPKLQELAIIMFNLRHYEKIWHEQFGAENRRNLNNWQAKADKWIKDNVEPITGTESQKEKWDNWKTESKDANK